VPIGNAHSYTYGNPERNSYRYANAHSNTNGYTNPYAHGNFDSTTDTDSTTTDTYANCNSDTNCYGDTYTNAYSKPIWECVPEANDDRPYQGSWHTVQFHGSSERH
jgi:hypothetical protein